MKERFGGGACGLGGNLPLIVGGGPRDMIPSAENTKRYAKRSNPQDRVERGKARMTIKLDVYRPFAHMCWIIIKAVEA